MRAERPLRKRLPEPRPLGNPTQSAQPLPSANNTHPLHSQTLFRLLQRSGMFRRGDASETRATSRKPGIPPNPPTMIPSHDEPRQLVCLNRRVDQRLLELAHRAIRMCCPSRKVPAPSGRTLAAALRLETPQQSGGTLETLLIAGDGHDLVVLTPLYIHQSISVTLLVGRGADCTALAATVGPAAHLAPRSHACLLKLDSPIPMEVIGLTAPTPKAAAKPDTNPPPEAPKPPRTKPHDGTVLVVEDDTAQQRLISKRLQTAGITVLTATTAAQATALLATTPIDIALLDLNLEDGDAEPTIAEARSTGFGRPLIAVTAVEDLRRLGDLFRLGVTDLLRKPCVTDDLIGIVQNHLAALPYTAGTSPITPINTGTTTTDFSQSAAIRAKELIDAARHADPEHTSLELAAFAEDARNAGFIQLATAARDASLAAASSNPERSLRLLELWIAQLAARIEAPAPPPAAIA